MKWLDEYGVNLSNFVLGARANLAALAETVRAVFEGDFSNVGTRALAARMAVFEEAAKRELQGAKEAEEGKQRFIGQARRAARAKEGEEAKKAAEKEAEAARKLAEQRVQFEQEAEDQLLAARIRATEEWSEAREKLELELLERLRDRALAEAERLGASTLVVTEAYLAAEAELRAKFAQERADEDARIKEEQARERAEALQGLFDLEMEAAAENAALREALEIEALEREREYRLANWNLTEEEKAELTERYEKIIFNTRSRYRRADLENERAAALARIEMAATTAQQVATIAAAVFGRNKGIAIAAAIIDTIAASVKAFNQGGGWPTGLLPMAVTLALGYQRVSEIRKTDISSGRGFDDPANDRLAYLGGRRWAEDMVRNISSGFGSRIQELAPASSSVSNSYRYGDIVIQGPVYGGDAGLRQLRRELDQAARRDAARRVR